MNRREFLMTTLAAFALSALPKLTFAENIPVSDAVKHKIDPKNKLGFGFMRLPLKNPGRPDLHRLHGSQSNGRSVFTTRFHLF